MLRLTGGTWRGRKLQVPEGIRPTTELVRKAAFDILGEAVRGARVLDACAGSGAYGLEALSRGAAHATFVEKDQRVARVLRGNVECLGAGTAARIEEMSVARFSLKGEERRGEGSGEKEGNATARGPFDVVFHDPPFEENSESDLQLLVSLARNGGWVFHERGDDTVYAPGGLAPADRRRYGRSRLLIFRPVTLSAPC